MAGSECLFYGPPDEAAAQAQAYVAQGFRILKVRVGLEPFALDIARLRAVREAVGDAIALAVDANQVDAQYRDGMLTVNVGKSATAKPRAIDVKVG